MKDVIVASAMPEAYQREHAKFLKTINEAKQQDLYLFAPPFEGPQRGTTKYYGKDVIMLTSNNYLGLSTHPEIIKVMKETLDQYGTGTCGARLHNGTTVLHTQLEERVADFMKTESAVVVSAGYMANLTAITALANDENSLVITDQLNHMSIVDAISMSNGMSNSEVRIFQHNDMSKLEYILSKSEKYPKKLIVVDGIYSMDGDIAPLDKIADLAEKYSACVMVDDAHAFGFYGENGRGTPEHFGVEDKIAIKMTTFSKSTSSVGGCISAPKDVCDYIRHASHPYLFNASLPPAIAAGIIKAIDIMEKETWRREKLWANTIRFRRSLIELGFDICESESPVIPIFIGDDMVTMQMSRMLINEGVYLASAIFPAVPQNKSRFRTTITASLSDEEIDIALDKLAKVARKFQII